MANNKSVINLLQELTIKDGYFPIYNFTQKRTDTLSFEFVCIVSCKTLIVHGAGSSKKEAKQNAAKNMLALWTADNKISVPENILSSPVANVAQSPSSCQQSSTSQHNVGMSQESSSIANMMQNLAKVYKTSLSCPQSSTSQHNYVETSQESSSVADLMQSLVKFDKMSLSCPQSPISQHNDVEMSQESSSVENVMQSLVKFDNMSLSCPQSSISQRNYIGMLQEFCQQKQINPADILYNVVYEEGLPHLKTFTMEVNLGPLRARGTALSKKSAKQEAAKKLLAQLDPKLVDLNLDDQNTDNTNIQDVNNKETLEDIIRNLGIGILDIGTAGINKESSSIAELTEKAKTRYLENINEKYNKGVSQENNPAIIKDFHTLFQKNYSNKIPDNIKDKMRIIRDNFIDRIDILDEIRKDIERLLKVKIQQVSVCSIKENHIVCIRVLSNPHITQIGVGETRIKAESHAMYNLVTAILIFLEVQ